jgi:hypothetical protein
VVTNGTIFAGQGPQVDWNGDGQTDLGGPTGTFYLGQPDDTFTVGPTWSGVSVTGPDQPPDFCGVGRFGVAGSWELLFVGDHYEGISGRLVYGDLAQVNQSFAGLTAGGQLTFRISTLVARERHGAWASVISTAMGSLTSPSRWRRAC